MPLLHLEPLPPRTTRGELLHFLITAGGIGRQQVGRIELRGVAATIEVPDGWDARLVKALDGAEFKDRRLRARAVHAASAGDDADHFRRLARLLELESQAEARQALEQAQRLSAAQAERTGNCLADLVILEESSGLGGRCLLTLGKRDRSQPLPWTRLQAGAPVLLSPEGGPAGRGWRGVVCDRDERSLRVALNDPPDEEEARTTYRLDPSGDEAARQRQLAALERARTASGDRLAELRRVLLGETPPDFGPDAAPLILDAALNGPQREAVHFPPSAPAPAVLPRPPATGKTTGVVELIRQAVRRGERVLACAPSNLAVDNLLERLLAWGERAVRLGHPARVLPGLREHTLDLLVEDHQDTRLARKLA